MDTRIKPGHFTSRKLFYTAVIVMVIMLIIDFGALGQQDQNANYWVRPDNSPNDTITGIIMKSKTEIYLTGSTGTVYFSSNFTNSYSELFSTSESLNAIDFDNQTIIVVGDNGFATMTLDDGITWNPITFPFTLTANLNNVEIQQNNIWIVGDSGTILYSNNTGQDWTIQTSPRSLDLNDVDFQDNSTGWIVGDNGYIIKTSSSGSSWITVSTQRTENLNGIDVETSASNRIWVVGDNGLFLYSFGTNFGSVFQNETTGTNANLYDVYSPAFNIVWVVGADSTILGYRGNEFKNKQILEDGEGVVLYAVYAISSDGLAAGNAIFYNQVGLIPAFVSERNWEDIWYFTKEVVPLLLQGLWAAVKVIAFSLFIGFFIGLTMATLRTIQNRPLNLIATMYSDLFRNTPLLVQLFFISFGLPELGWNPPVFIDAVLALSLNTGAYQSEIIRSGIQAIPKGQMEAARSLGMNNVQAMRHIILPQAVRITIPPLSNEAVIMFLNTAQLSVIAYEEITRIGQLIATTTFLWSRTFLYVGLTYFIITYSITQLLRRVERSLSIPGLGGGEI